jgi:hypothetical protein
MATCVWLSHSLRIFSASYQGNPNVFSVNSVCWTADIWRCYRKSDFHMVCVGTELCHNHGSSVAVTIWYDQIIQWGQEHCMGLMRINSMYSTSRTVRMIKSRTLPSCCVVLCILCVVLCIFVLFYILFVSWHPLYCLCVYVYWTTATGWLPNCS